MIVRRSYRVVGGGPGAASPRSPGLVTSPRYSPTSQGYRVVRNPAHPSATQTMPADLAAGAGQAALGPGGPYGQGSDWNFDPDDPRFGAGSGISSPPDFGGIRNGMPYSSLYNPWAPGTRLGAQAGKTPGGAALAQWLGSNYGSDFGHSWAQDWGPGGRFGNRGTSTGWVSGDESLSDLANQYWSDKAHESVAQDRAAAAFANGDHAGYRKYIQLAYGYDAAARNDLDRWGDRVASDVHASVGEVRAATQHVAQGVYHFVSGAPDPGPDPDWVISPALGTGSASTSSGQVPRIDNPRPPTRQELAAALYRLSQQGRFGQDAAWWGSQWLHSPDGDSGSDGEDSGAVPQRTVLGGRQHWYDWVARPNLR